MQGNSQESEPLLTPRGENPNVRRAYKFLTHPRVANASLEKRIAFLRSKGCSDEEITEARAMMPDEEAGSYGALPPLEETRRKARPPKRQITKPPQKKQNNDKQQQVAKSSPAPRRRRLDVGRLFLPVLCFLVVFAVVFCIIWFRLVQKLARSLRHESSRRRPPSYSYSYSYSYELEIIEEYY